MSGFNVIETMARWRPVGLGSSGRSPSAKADVRQDERELADLGEPRRHREGQSRGAAEQGHDGEGSHGLGGHDDEDDADHGRDAGQQ